MTERERHIRTLKHPLLYGAVLMLAVIAVLAAASQLIGS